MKSQLIRMKSYQILIILMICVQNQENADRRDYDDKRWRCWLS
jgi:hypothetical protein